MANSVLEVIFRGRDESLGSTASGISRTFGNVGASIRNGLAVGATAIAGIAVGAASVGTKLVGLGADANETASLIQTSLGGATDGFNERLRALANESNRSFYELQQGSSTLIAMTKAMGASEDGAADFGATFAGMASDLGSFFNRTDAEVFQDLQSALGGSSETLQKYGIDIRETTLKQMALNQGLIESASDTLPSLVRAQLIQQAIAEQASDAMGDAAATSDSWQNSMKGLRARVLDAATAAGQKLIPALTPLLQLVGDLATNGIAWLSEKFEKLLPHIETAVLFVTDLFTQFSEGEGTLFAISEQITGIKDRVLEFLEPALSWIENNIILSDALTALGIVLGGVVLSALISVATAAAPLIIAVGALIGIVALVRTAWEENWGGIQEKMAAVWAFLQPVLQQIINWFQVNIPIAIEFLKNAWETVLLPAIQAVWEWLETTLMPFIRDILVPWLQENIPAAIQALSDFWNNTLMPALEAVWDFLTVQMMPIWEALAEFFNTAMTVAITALQGIWENVLLPAMTKAYDFVKDKLGPIFEWLKSSVIQPVSDSFAGLGDMIQQVADFIIDLKNGLEDIQLPDWMTPGSPTPWEIGLKGVRGQMAMLNTRELPGLQANLEGFNQSGASNQSTVHNNQTFNWNVNTSSFNPESAGRAAAAFAGGI